MRITADFKTVANRRSEFANSLRAKLAELANVPENSLRITGLRPGSIIAEMLILPSVVVDPMTKGLHALQIVEQLRSAAANHAGELCALAGSGADGCTVNLQDMGVAAASVDPIPKQKSQRKRQEEKAAGNDSKDHTLKMVMIAALCWIPLGLIGSCIITMRIARNRRQCIV